MLGVWLSDPTEDIDEIDEIDDVDEIDIRAEGLDLRVVCEFKSVCKVIDDRATIASRVAAIVDPVIMRVAVVVVVVVVVGFGIVVITMRPWLC